MTPTIEKPRTRAAALVALDGRTYPLESARLTARAEGGLALSTLSQTFANPYDDALEVLYTLPLPADGAVLGYSIRIGETVYRAEVRPREQATREYREALYQGRTAGLLEQSRPDTFQQKLGNVPPRTRVEITIDVLHPLAFVTAAGTTPQWEYRFPTVSGVRYFGEPGRVSDADDLNPDRGAGTSIPTRIELAITIGDEFEGSASSPSHTIEFSQMESSTQVAFKQGERLDRDVVLRWAAARGEVGIHVREGRGLAGDNGRYALVTLVPPAVPAATFRRDLTVLIDASGSMHGMPLDLARRVTGDLLRSLGAGDRFELLAFSNSVRKLTRGLVKFDQRSLADALRELGKLEASGGTEMEHAVEEALKPLRDEAQRQVVLVTDGQIGFEAGVVARIAAAGNARLHVVGVGSAPNRSLTQQAAAAGRGLEVLVTDELAANEAARRLIAGTAHPVLTGLELSGTALTGDRSAALRDVFEGQPLTFTVELSREGGTLELGGRLAGSNDAWMWRVIAPAEGANRALESTPLPIGALHGRALIAEIELQFNPFSGRRPNALDQRIEALGMRHKIATRRTSLVAIADQQSVDPALKSRSERLPVELPHGVSAEGVGLERLTMTASMPTTMDSSMMYELSRAGEAQVMRTKRETLRSLGGALLTGAGKPSPRGVPKWLKARSGDPGIIVPLATWVAFDQLALEFLVPDGGFEIPGGRVWLWGDDDDAAAIESELVSELSASTGAEVAGTAVRIVVRMPTEESWPAPRMLTVKWKAAPKQRSTKGGYSTRKLVCLLPPRRPAP